MAFASDLQADESMFHTGYRVFVQAVEILSTSPAEQCELMGDYNVAWELKEDVQAGKYFVGLGYLTQVHEAWIYALVGALEGVPMQVFPSGAGREINLLAMQHPTWIPLRVIASHVLKALDPFTLKNAKYLRLA